MKRITVALLICYLLLGGCQDRDPEELAGTDKLPDAFTIVPATARLPGAAVLFPPVTVSGIDGSVEIRVNAGAGEIAGEYSLDDGATFQSGASLVESGQEVIFRLRTGSEFSSQTRSTVTIGEYSTTLIAATMAQPELTVAVSPISRLSFSWTAPEEGADITTYRLYLESASSASMPLGVPVPDTTFESVVDIDLLNIEWLRDRFVLQACDDDYCVEVAAHEATPALALAAVGHLKASNPTLNDQFGSRLALDGEVLVIGVPGEDSTEIGIHAAGGGLQQDNSSVDSGAVYVFRWNGTAWIHEAFIKASNTDSVDAFGNSVAIDGNLLAVGAPLEDGTAMGPHAADGGEQSSDAANASGAVYVYRYEDGAWVHEAYIKASNTESGDRFGTSVALSGDTLAVGAPREDSSEVGAHPAADGAQADNNANASGAVYVYRRNGASWEAEAYIKAFNTGSNDAFGNAIALDRDVLIVAAPVEASMSVGVQHPEDANPTDDAAPGSGAVYVYRRNETGWNGEAYIKPSNTGLNQAFGASLALSGEHLVVGSSGENRDARGVHSPNDGNHADFEVNSSGAVYTYRYDGSTWNHEAYIKAPDTSEYDEFGASVALGGDRLIIGAPRENAPATGIFRNAIDADQAQSTCGEEFQAGMLCDSMNSGAAYVYERDDAPAGWRFVAYLKAPIPLRRNDDGFEGDGLFGKAVAVSEEFAVVGAPGDRTPMKYKDGQLQELETDKPLSDKESCQDGFGNGDGDLDCMASGAAFMY